MPRPSQHKACARNTFAASDAEHPGRRLKIKQRELHKHASNEVAVQLSSLYGPTCKAGPVFFSAEIIGGTCIRSPVRPAMARSTSARHRANLVPAPPAHRHPENQWPHLTEIHLRKSYLRHQAVGKLGARRSIITSNPVAQDQACRHGQLRHPNGGYDPPHHARSNRTVYQPTVCRQAERPKGVVWTLLVSFRPGLPCRRFSSSCLTIPGARAPLRRSDVKPDRLRQLNHQFKLQARSIFDGDITVNAF